MELRRITLTWNRGYAHGNPGERVVITSTGTSDPLALSLTYGRINVSNDTYYAAVNFPSGSNLPTAYMAIWTNSGGTILKREYPVSAGNTGIFMVLKRPSTAAVWLYIMSSSNSQKYAFMEKTISVESLWYDRSEADVTACKEYTNKLLTNGLSVHGGWDSLDEVLERADYMSGHKGAYNASDMNRVGTVTQIVADYLASCITNLASYAASKGVTQTDDMKMPYEASDISVTVKTDWKVSDIPTTPQMNVYLGNISNIYSLGTVPSTTPAPAWMSYNIDWSMANLVEQILHDAYYGAVEIYNKCRQAIDEAVG